MFRAFRIFSFLSLCFVFTLHADDSSQEVNHILMCKDSLDMFEWDLEFIKKANHSIEISACFTGGTILQRLLKALEERMEEAPQLQVYIIGAPILIDQADHDKIASIQTKFPGRLHFQLTDGVVVFFPDYSAIDNHIKCVVVDEKYFSCGGTNIDEVLCGNGTFTPKRRENAGLARRNLPAGARDQDIIGRGPMAKELRIMFYKLYHLWDHYIDQGNCFEKDLETFKNNSTYYPISENEKPIVEKFDNSSLVFPAPHIKLFICGPADSTNPIRQEYIRLINEAKEEIVIGNMYCNPVPQLFEALKNAAQRGVSITYITNGCRKNSPAYTVYFCWANRINYAPLFYGRDWHFWQYDEAAMAPLAKTRIFEYNVPDVLYHKKVMVVDRKYTVVGSYNFGLRSDISDFEQMVVIESERAAQECLEIINKDLQLSEEVSVEEAASWYFDPKIFYLGAAQRQFYGFL